MINYCVSLFLDFLYPKLCYGCGTTGTYLCPTCQLSLVTKESFHPASSSLDGVISVFRYTGTIRQMIEDYKFNFVFDLAPTFADLIFQNLTKNFPNILKYWQENNFTLVPVPLHYTRQNWRGFNQSILIGELLSSKLKLKFIPDLLIRTVSSTPQSTIKDKRLRRQNTQNIFEINSSFTPSLSMVADITLRDEGVGGGLDKLNDKWLNIILLDDVYTTGSTINSATKTIEEILYKNIFKGVGGLNLWSLTIAG